MCGIIGIINLDRRPFPGDVIARGLSHLKDRGNGLGSGYAGYGIYPDNADDWCFHIFFSSEDARLKTEQRLDAAFTVVKKEPVPVRPLTSVKRPPVIWRYFLKIPALRSTTTGTLEEREKKYIFALVMEINASGEGSFVVSSGKNMGIFKGVGFPDEIAEFYRLSDYKATAWTAHNRFPTNTPGWWGGAHPFGIADLSLVHNGEISSFGINKRYLESFGYHLALQTDSEAILYLFDFLTRVHRLPLEIASAALTPPHWDIIDRMPSDDKKLFTAIRMTYASCLINGPSALVLGFKDGLMGLNDRIKLRPLVAAESRSYAYLSSEESAITAIATEKLTKITHPAAGEPAIFRYRAAEKKKRHNEKNTKTTRV